MEIAYPSKSIALVISLEMSCWLVTVCYTMTRSDQVSTMEKQLTLTDAKARFSEVIDKVSEGDEVLITRMGEPVAVISRYVPDKGKRPLGILKGKIEMSEDFDEWPEDLASDWGIPDK